MSAGDEEEVLHGGNTSVVFKVGDTVRRSSGPWTPAVHDLIRHVRLEGFDLAPEPLGLDDMGREVLRYIPGETIGSTQPWPSWVWADDLLIQAGAAARSYHVAVSSYRPLGPVVWRDSMAELAVGEIVCHNDFAPYNVVAKGGRLVGLIDWDFAAPGTPLWELAFMAWQWVPLHHPALAASLGAPAESPMRRMRLLCDSYGLADRSLMIQTIIRRIDSSRVGIERFAAQGDAAFVRLQKEGHAEHMAMTLDYMDAVAADLASALET